VPGNGLERVSIGGLEYGLGVTYAPRRHQPDTRPRKLVAFEPAEGWNGGKVTVEVVGRTRAHRDTVCGFWWSCWAGGRVNDQVEPERSSSGGR
jgi:hypothetical protein